MIRNLPHRRINGYLGCCEAPGARLAVLEAAYIANAEQPQAYAETVLDFLLRQGVYA